MSTTHSAPEGAEADLATRNRRVVGKLNDWLEHEDFAPHDVIAAAAARIDALEAALRPFAKAGELFGPREPGSYDQSIYAPAAGDEYALSADHLRAARAALKD